MKLWISAAAIAAALLTPAFAADSAGSRPAFTFATVAQGRSVLMARDDFVERMSPFDRASRLKTDWEIPEDAYLEFVGTNVTAWPGGEQAMVETALSKIRPQLDALSLPWPETIHLIRTTGDEEGGAAYTRANAIILPAGEFARGRKEQLHRTIAHELFHVLSRQNPGLKEKLYAAIGFRNCGEINFPSSLSAIKLTNPDAPKNDHCIKVQVGGAPTEAIPILYSKSAKYDPARGGEFFDYLQFKFLLVDTKTAGGALAATYDDANPRLIDPKFLSGYLEQIGRNTNYIIHPEEILADNFALLVLNGKKVPSPEILDRMKAIFSEARK